LGDEGIRKAHAFHKPFGYGDVIASEIKSSGKEHKPQEGRKMIAVYLTFLFLIDFSALR
jgi:hypothetical protein